MKTTEFLYEKLATTLEDSIFNGILTYGDKLPSVRSAAKAHQVSASTIFQAYYALEAKGLVAARAKSGYYVSYRQPIVKAEPEITLKSLPKISNITGDYIVQEMLTVLTDETYQQLSRAIPSKEYLPSAKLNKCVKTVLKAESYNTTMYPNPQGNEELRKRIGLQLLKTGKSYAKEDIVVTSGCTEALILSLKETTEKGDIILTDKISYYGITQMIKSLGLKTILVPVSSSKGLDVDFVEKAVKKFNVKACLFTTNFNNPTGGILSTTDKKRLVDIVKTHKIPLIEDDVYGELYFGKNRPDTCKQYDLYGWVIYCSSFSKTLSPSYRIGYCIAGRFQKKIALTKRISSFGVSELPQQTLALFLRNGRYDNYLKNLRTTLHTNMLKYYKLIVSCFPKEIVFMPPKGGYVFWISFPDKFDGYQLFLAAKEKGISVIPGQVFSLQEAYKNHIRLSFAEPLDEKRIKAIKLVGNLAKKMLQ